MSSTFHALVLLGVMAFAVSQAPPANNEAPPPFLAGAPPAKLAEFQKLVANSHTKTDAQVDREVENWISQQDPSIKTKFAAFKSEMQAQESKADAAHKAAVAAFSPEAREADTKLAAIANNPALTAQQKGQEIEKYVNGLPPKVRAEIEKAMQG